MKRSLAITLLATLVLAACGQEESTPPRGGSERKGTLHFVLDGPFTVGQRVEVRLANDTEVPYVYNEIYEACAMTFTKPDGQEFLVPPGTHCDLVVEKTLQPGETATLFVWKLDECTKDRWGCVRSESLPPGTYTMTGTFSPKGSRAPATEVSATFEVVA